MLDLHTIRNHAQKIRRGAEDGYESVPMRLVMADLVTPILQLIGALEQMKHQRWYVLEEAMLRSGWTRKWFDKPLKSLGGRSRLQAWKDEGFADKTSNGIWLVHPAKVLEPRSGYKSPVLQQQVPRDDGGESMATTRGADSDSTAIADSLMGGM